jgi:ABC-type nitrate/sulfonate/bicarbonate transport system substrate-binding protein
MHNHHRMEWTSKFWVTAAAVVVCCGVVSLAAYSAPSAAQNKHQASPVLTTVSLGLQPDFDYMLFPVAHALGLDKQLGLNLTFTYFSQVGPEVEALARGSVDLVSSCSACDFAYYKSMPTLRDIIITDQFKGFIVIGRHSAPSYDALITKGDTPAAARQAVYSYMKGRTFDIDQATFGGLLDAMLAYAHLPVSAVKVKDFANDASAATAFLAGSGDFYMGSLTQEARLLVNFPSQVANVGGTSILGPAGLWYSTMATTQAWLQANRTTAVKLEALSMRAATLLATDSKKVLPLITSNLNQHSGSDFTVAEVNRELQAFIAFTTVTSAKDAVYNPHSNLYWEVSVNYYAREDKKSGILSQGANPAKFNLDQQLFTQFEADSSLVSWAS